MSLRIDALGRRVYRDDVEVHVGRKEFDLLAYLQARPGEALRSEELIREVWEREWFKADAALLRAMLSRLRKLTGATITSVPGYGYRLDA